MKKCQVILLLSASLVATGFSADTDNRLRFSANRFSIAPLEGTSDTMPYQAVMMSLPATEGFAPNVIVQIQPYDGSIRDYASLSQQQFAAAGFNVISEEVSEAAVVWEYSGMLHGRRLHWYARAVQNQNRIYLVTATATASQWKSLSEKLKSCVDSFKIDNGEQESGHVRK